MALAVDPSDPRRLWAGYYAPGGLATSHDGGGTWVIGAEGLGDNPIFDLLPLPRGSLWAATRDGLLQSTDGGETWRPADKGLPRGAAFVLAANESGRVYVGLDDAGLYVGEPSESQWTSLARDERLAAAAVLSLAVSSDGKQLYAGTAGRGLFASRDAGHNWTAAFPGNYVPNLALYPDQPTTAIASLRDHLVRTYDGGKSWEELPIPWTRDEVVSLLWLADGGMLWAGSGQGRVYCSQDAGDSWVEMKARVSTEGGVLALATADRQLPGSPQRLLAGTWTGIYASHILGGCDNSGRTWAYLSPSLGFPNANALLATETGLLIGTRAGLFRWRPAERRWAKVSLKHPQGGESPPGGITTLAVSPSDRQVFYAGTASSGLYRSDDGGGSWSQVPSDLEIGIRALAIAPDDADHIYILASWERMYESRDGGSSWQAHWTGLGITTEAISLAIDPVNPFIIYLGTDIGLYRSRYGGEDWQAMGRPLDDQTVLTLVARRDSNVEGASSVLYIGATRGAYRSYDGGCTVTPWGQGLEDISVTALLFDPNDSRAVYASTAYAGLYRSVDGGETWQSIEGPLELADEAVERMAWGPEGELFVASAGGVWVGKSGGNNR